MSENLPHLIAEHADEASFLWLQRAHAVDAPNYLRQQFADLDERLAAHVDGLRVAGEEGWKVAEAALDNEGPEDFFPAGVLALEAPDDRFDAVVARVNGAPEAVPGLVSSLGWTSLRFVGERMQNLLGDAAPLRQKLGMAACALHRQDPGSALERCLASSSPGVRIRALRAAGEVGRADVGPHLTAALAGATPEERFWAAWSGVLLGDRGASLEALAERSLRPGPRQPQALRLLLLAKGLAEGAATLRSLEEQGGEAVRLAVIGAGLVGDSARVPWLIEQMAKPALARVAAESFALVTGADFNLDALEAPPPDGFAEGPSEDPDDEDVEVPADIALPWPDVQRVQTWWARNASRFAPGKRCFLGEPVSTALCLGVLRTGYQRQRVLAAQHLSLLEPGTPLFPTSAPAWRQQRWLDALS